MGRAGSNPRAHGLARAHLLGDRTTVSLFGTPVNTTRTYHRFSDMDDDVVDAGILPGIHFRFADEVARRQGTAAADWGSATSCGIRGKRRW
jgi:hypothetical protein